MSASVLRSASSISSSCSSSSPLRGQQRWRCLSALKESGRSAGAGERKNVAVLGASGYTGAEVLRFIAAHPRLDVKTLTAERQAGKPIAEVFPQLQVAAASSLPPLLVPVSDVDWGEVDVTFCCLPHGTTQEIVNGIPAHVKVVDLSADFRLRNIETYAEWYGAPHAAATLQEEAVYGLSELNRSAIVNARLVANPGCYPTCSQLPLVPLLQAGVVSAEAIVIDAKSGASGAGRGVKQGLLYTELAEGMQSYGVTRHRHSPEIEQGLSDASGKEVTVSFTPHLIPMSRGMQCTIYGTLEGAMTVEDARRVLVEKYKEEQFVHVLEEGVVPQTRHVTGSNHCLMNVFPDRIAGRIIIISVIDNLVKGASGQAMQNMNLMLGFEEATAVDGLPVFP